MVKNYTISVLNSKLAEASIDFWLSNPQKIDNVIDFINELNKAPVKLSAAEQAKKEAKDAELTRIRALISKQVSEGGSSIRLMSRPIWDDTIEQLRADGFKLIIGNISYYGDSYIVSWD
jgi:hypothetical protein